MEQELRLAVLKKRVWADYEQLLRVVFSCFQGEKMLISLEKTLLLGVCTKNLKRKRFL